VALTTALAAVLMMAAIGGSVVLNTITETTIAASHRDSIRTLYAAEAGIALSVSRLRHTADWSAVAPAQGGTVLVQGSIADLLSLNTMDPRLTVVASVFRDPNGNPDVLIVQAVASGAGRIRRAVHVTLRRAPAVENATMRTIETLLWRER
jgi:hypothetical protein